MVHKERSNFLVIYMQSFRQIPFQLMQQTYKITTHTLKEWEHGAHMVKQSIFVTPGDFCSFKQANNILAVTSEKPSHSVLFEVVLQFLTVPFLVI
ncbi:hypothetical protein BgAZ_102560 [Babesia gibsoni]|uniref:Uncharacterized protein n=1 Tax=Babesia gibsoni TaxID=33632 RepID=A0AAD8PFM0_BABGI|nr:hypothetical protein BgAZ_102560 [Babesia gibsoni]